MQWRGTADLIEPHVERNHRFLEEALELVQSLGCTARRTLVDYVFGLLDGNVNQEMGGVMVTLAALANCHDIDMNKRAHVLTKIDVIRAKQAAKPKHSPQPTAPVRGASISPEVGSTGRARRTSECARTRSSGRRDDRVQQRAPE